MHRKALAGISVWSIALPVVSVLLLAEIWERPLGCVLLSIVVTTLVAAVFTAVLQDAVHPVFFAVFLSLAVVP